MALIPFEMRALLSDPEGTVPPRRTVPPPPGMQEYPLSILKIPSQSEELRLIIVAPYGRYSLLYSPNYIKVPDFRLTVSPFLFLHPHEEMPPSSLPPPLVITKRPASPPSLEPLVRFVDPWEGSGFLLLIFRCSLQDDLNNLTPPRSSLRRKGPLRVIGSPICMFLFGPLGTRNYR